MRTPFKLGGIIGMFMLHSCCVRPNASDRTMETVFRNHARSFDALKEMITRDSEVSAVFSSYTVPSFDIISQRGFSEARWRSYRELLKSIGVAGIAKTPSGIAFEASVFGLGLHAIYKGYMYTETQPPRLEKTLDDVSGGDCHPVYRPLSTPAWYLYLTDCVHDYREIVHGPPK